MSTLVLMTRKGCCLCAGLEEKLRALEPPLAFELLDVDADPALQARFGLEVPLLVRRTPADEQVLPRVPPRLAGGSLQVWLQKHGFCAHQA